MSFRAKKILRLLNRILRYSVFPLVLFAVIVFYLYSLRTTNIPVESEIDEYTTSEPVHTSSAVSEKEDNPLKNFIDGLTGDGETGEKTDQKDCKITILNVGQASCAIIESRGEYMIFDGGDRGTSSYVVAYCRQRGITSFKYLVASHYHADHIYGLIGILESGILVENVICPDYVTDTSAQKAFYERVPEEKRTIPYVLQTFSLGDVQAECISPVTEDYSDDNGYSVGFLFTCGDFSFLIDGDATQETEIDMLDEQLDIDADVLIVPHHGSTYSSSLDWLNKVSPETAIISCGENNSYYHPHEGTLERLKKCGVTALYRTDLNGTMTIVSDGETYSVEAEKEASEEEKWIPGNGEETDKVTSELWETDNSVIEPYYIGNSASKRFHRPSCKQLPKEDRRVLFSNRNDALQNSYLPCGACNP